MDDFWPPLSGLVDPVREAVILRKDNSLPYVGLEHLESYCSRIGKKGLSGDSISMNIAFKSGDILFGKLRPNLHKSVIADFPGYCSTEFIVLRSKAVICPSYAGWVMRSEQVFNEAICSLS